MNKLSKSIFKLLVEEIYEKPLNNFPIFVDAKLYGMTRNELYFKMREVNILGRRYFYPLISEFSVYKGLPSSVKENLPNAHKMADRVICLPMHHEMSEIDIDRVIEIIKR